MSKNEFNDEYKYGFNDGEIFNYKSQKGLSEQIVREISAIKNEPEWMLEYRLQAYRKFIEMPMPSFGPKFEIDFNDFTYYVKPSDKTEKSWDDVPEKIKDTFDKLGIPEAEQKFLAGVSTQYESEVVYHNMLQEVEQKGVIFLDTDTALKKYPDLFKKYFNSVVPYTDNKFSALNSAVWSGGSFIYVPKDVKLDKPLQSYFRINSERMGQFERTLIIVDEGADVHYVEGCTAPIYASQSLHAAVVEIIVHKHAKCRYSTVQNWSQNVMNLVTKRAKCYDYAVMEWVDGNVGSSITMKYPAVILAGEGSRANCISIAVASDNQVLDAGAKMIHLAKNTSSNIVSKSIARKGGKVNYRGLVSLGKLAENAYAKIECDTLILDDISSSDTIPNNKVDNAKAKVEHEATVTNVSEQQLFYLMSRGLSEQQAVEMIVMGFIAPFSRELPMEYAVELNQLLKLNMEDSIG